jgi:predicted DCC family thiol-disulfide oxidoreductase YuxK
MTVNQSPRTNRHFIILFDGVCNFCNFWISFLLDRDRKDKFRFVALQSEKGNEPLTRINFFYRRLRNFFNRRGQIFYQVNSIIKSCKKPFGVLEDFICVYSCSKINERFCLQFNCQKPP